MNTNHPDMAQDFQDTDPTGVDWLDITLSSHDVILDTAKPKEWNKAVEEWAAYRGYSLKISPVEGTNKTFVQYSLPHHEACLDFLTQLYRHSFDAHARKIELAEAEVHIWKDEDTLPWIVNSNPPADQDTSFDDILKCTSVVVMSGAKADYWQKAVKEWADYTQCETTCDLIQSSDGTLSIFEFDIPEASLEFCRQASIHAFDVQAKEIERREAGVRLEQAKSPISWAPSPEHNR